MTDNTNASDKDKANIADAAARQARADAERLAADKAKESSRDGQK
jgi:hypothetical protein